MDVFIFCAVLDVSRSLERRTRLAPKNGLEL